MENKIEISEYRQKLHILKSEYEAQGFWLIVEQINKLILQDIEG